MKTFRRKRYSSSPAYIDSSMLVAYLIGLVWFAVWIASETSEIIAPIWLGGGIIAVGLYQVSMLWLLRQYWEVDRILGIFANNVVCLGLYFALAEAIINIQLPTNLPILSVFANNVESFSPGAVAVSYTVICIVCGLVTLHVVYVLEKIRFVGVLKQKIYLDKIDLLIDHSLDKISFWISESNWGWFAVPIALLSFVLVSVLGLAVLFT